MKKRFLKDSIYVIETNIDDMNPLVYETLFEKLYKKGALEVYLTGVQMKRSRPGILVSVLSPKNKLEKIAEVIFRETTTFGIRFHEVERLKLCRKKTSYRGKWGKMRVDEGYLGERLTTVSPEYKDCLRIAIKKKTPIKEILRGER